jgi:hypothetical protein
MKYLDLAKWAQNNAERGAQYQKTFEDRIIQQIPDSL